MIHDGAIDKQLIIKIIMNQQIQQTISQSQISQLSVDSSAALSESLSHDSTQSLVSQRISVSNKISNQNINQNYLHNQNIWSPIQLPRFGQEKRKSDLFGKFQQQFVGFVGLGKKDKGKAIAINQSKLKKAKKFMDFDEQQRISTFQISAEKTVEVKKQNQQNDSDSTQSIGDIKQQLKKQEQNDLYPPQFQFPDFSLGFKSLGTGKAIQISQQSTNRVKLLFSDFDISQKQTKSKLQKLKISPHPKIVKLSPNSKQQPRFTNFTKTQKIKPLPQIKNITPNANINNKKSALIKINQDRKILDKLMGKVGDKYENIRLYDLKQISKQNIKKLAIYWKQEKQKFEIQGIKHNKQICGVTWCYFCKKYQNQQIIVTKQFIIEELYKLLTFQQATKQKLPKLISLTLLKLLKYTYFVPEIKNKQLNPNNLLLQTYKKSLLLQKQMLSPLQFSLSTVISSNGKNLGKHITLILIDIAYVQQMDLYFLQLSDDWISVYAVISSTNQLYRLINSKLLVGTKINIVNWSIYPVSNILQFHSNKQVANSKSICIQFNYNNCMPAKFWQKLGWPTQLFYRPINKCKQAGGSIPLVEGIIIRMFIIKNNKNIATSYLQILLNQGTCIIMKVGLSQQVSLVQLFRLYYCYHFLKIKKISSGMLEFVANSKFYEVQDNQRMERVKELFKERLLNVSFDRNGCQNIKGFGNGDENGNRNQNSYGNEKQVDGLQQKTNAQNSNTNFYSNSIHTNTNNTNIKRNYIDLVTKSGQIKIGNTKINIQQKIQGTVLLQQYTMSHTPDGIAITRGDRGSCLRRIPKIYDNIQYKVL